MLWKLTSALAILIVGIAVGVIAGETAGLVVAAVMLVASVVIGQTEFVHRR